MAVAAARAFCGASAAAEPAMTSGVAAAPLRNERRELCRLDFISFRFLWDCLGRGDDAAGDQARPAFIPYIVFCARKANVSARGSLTSALIANWHLAASLCIARETQARELPARIGRKEVSIACADVAGRCRARSAAQHVLAAHELAVVLTDRAGGTAEAGVRSVVAARPFPDLAE